MVDKLEANHKVPWRSTLSVRKIGRFLAGLIATLPVMSHSLGTASADEELALETMNNTLNYSLKMQTFLDSFYFNLDSSFLQEKGIDSTAKLIGKTLSQNIHGLETFLYTTEKGYMPGFGDPIPLNNNSMIERWFETVDIRHDFSSTTDLSEINSKQEDYLDELGTGDLVFLQTRESNFGLNQYSAAYIVYKIEDKTFFVKYNKNNESLEFSDLDAVLSDLFTNPETGEIDTTPTSTGTGGESSLKVLTVKRDLFSSGLLNAWMGFNRDIDPLVEREVQGFGVTEIGFYGAIRAWGGLSRNETGNEIIEPREFINNFWNKYDIVQENLETAADASAHLDYILMGADGNFNPYFNDVIKELLRSREEEGRQLPALTLDLRTPADWSTQDVIRVVNEIFSGESEFVDYDLLKEYIDKGGKLGLSIDFEETALGQGAIDALEINRIYRIFLQRMRESTLTDETFNYHNYPFIVYDFADGTIVGDANSLLTGILLIDTSISPNIESKKMVLSSLGEKHFNLGSMLFYSEFAPYLAIQQQSTDRKGNFEDTFLQDLGDVEQFLKSLEFNNKLALFFQ